MESVAYVTLIIPSEKFFNSTFKYLTQGEHFKYCGKYYSYDSANTYFFMKDTIEIWCYELSEPPYNYLDMDETIDWTNGGK